MTTCFFPGHKQGAATMPPTRARVAFTLVELLVVIGIIALLIGILFPVLGKARNAGKTAVCLSNIRSLGTSAISYSSDHDRRLPQPSHDDNILESGSTATAIASRRLQGQALWYNALDFYLGQSRKDYRSGSGAADQRNYAEFKQDPAYQDLPVIVNSTEYGLDDVRTIKMNAYFGHEPLSGGFDSTATSGPQAGNLVWFYRITDVPNPAITMVFADGRAHDTPSSTTGSISPKDFGMNESFLGLRHDDAANLGRVDGSAAMESNPIKQTSGGYRGWHDRMLEPNRTLWPDVVFNFRPESMQ